MYLSLLKQCVYLASVCRSFQCPISALTKAGRGGLLFRFTCSVVLWGGGHCRQTSLACVGRIRSVLATLGSRLLYRGRALSCLHFPGRSCSGSGFRVLHKDADSVGPAFFAFLTRAAQAARSLTGALSPGAEHLIPSAVPASVSPRTGLVRLVSLLGS